MDRIQHALVGMIAVRGAALGAPELFGLWSETCRHGSKYSSICGETAALKLRKGLVFISTYISLSNLCFLQARLLVAVSSFGCLLKPWPTTIVGSSRLWHPPYNKGPERSPKHYDLTSFWHLPRHYKSKHFFTQEPRLHPPSP